MEISLPKIENPLRGKALLDKHDTFYDAPFVRSLVRRVRKIDSGVGAVLYHEKKLLVIFWKNIVVGLVPMVAVETTDEAWKRQVKDIENRIRMIRLGLLPVRRLGEQMKNLNRKSGKRL